MSVSCGTRCAACSARWAVRRRKSGARGWRQWKHLTRLVRRLFHKVRVTRRASEEHVEAYLGRCHELVARAEATLPDLVAHGVKAWKIVEIESYIAHAKRQIDQVERRLLKGETIPQDEKLFSIFEPHTRWISKGKAGVSGGARGSGLHPRGPARLRPAPRGHVGGQ